MSTKKSTPGKSKLRDSSKKSSATKPQSIRLKEFLQNFHDTDLYAKDRSFCFIIGSGAALSSGIPTGASLVNRWLVEMHDMDDGSDKRILPPHAKIEDYADALLDGEKERLKKWSEERFKGIPGFTFEDRASSYGHIYQARFANDPDLGQRFLRALIHRRKPSIGFHLLARILNRTRHNVVITTNFDHLVEDAIAITENEAVQSFNHGGLAEFVQSRPEHPAVAKIHGDILLKTFNAAGELEQLSPSWQKALRSLFQTYTPIVIGYGGNDPGFMSFLIEELKTWGKDRRCYWFVRKESRFQAIPSCAELADIRALRLVECPGFTELMLKLNEIINFDPLHVELGRRADEIAAELKEAETKALGDLAEHERAKRETLAMEATKAFAEDLSDGRVSATKVAAGDTWREWRAHLDECFDSKKRQEILKEALAQFPGNRPIQAMAAFLDVRGQPSDDSAFERLQKLLKESEAELGADNDETLAIMHSFAGANLYRNELERAEFLCRRTIAGRERVLSAEHPDTLSSRMNLANALHAQGKNGEAEQEYRMVVKLQERVLGSEHPHTLISRMNLAIVLKGQGKYGEAEQEFRTVVKSQERVLGSEHPRTLISRMNLAITLKGQGKYGEAEQEFRTVVKIQERVLGSEYPEVALSCYNLALCLEVQQDMREALAFILRAEQVWTKVSGPDHPYTKAAKRIRERIEAAIKAGK
ncbi:MAG: tetratricopeptide repeat protein [Verrucomicrobiaceae bacterium]|nr:tetratricopeptide repeat protein [Verrucomicrobiaceae bacterium]